MEGVINMKAFKYFIFAFFVFVGTLLHVRADENCSYKDQAALIKEASNVKKSYEFINNDPLNRHFMIYITNISDNLRLEITNDYLDKQKLEVTSLDMQNGAYTIETNIASRKVTYTINIYSKSDKCYNQKLLTTRVVTPRYNEYSTSYICEQVPDFKYCGEFYDTSKLTYSEFLKKGEEYKLKNAKEEEVEKKGFFASILAFLNKYKWYIIGGVLLAAAITFTVIFIHKKRLEKRGLV